MFPRQLRISGSSRLPAAVAGFILCGLLVLPQRSAPAERAGGPVLVELFTSQGCSSCPPADRLLTRLGEENGGEIVPLAFHIDSWNRLGWTDPFSSAAWTRRQQAYTRELAATAYTPQVVVGGRVEVLGSDERAIRAAVADAAGGARGDLALTLAPAPSELGVTVVVELPDALRERKLDLMVALFESGLVTPVERGENGGATLRNDYVVRRLERAGRLRRRDPARTQHTLSLKLAEDWRRSKLGVAAFLQDRKTMAIYGVAARALDSAAAATATSAR